MRRVVLLLLLLLALLATGSAGAPAPAGPDEEFEPSERLPVDRAISFPADI